MKTYSPNRNVYAALTLTDAHTCVNNGQFSWLHHHTNNMVQRRVKRMPLVSTFNRVSNPANILKLTLIQICHNLCYLKPP